MNDLHRQLASLHGDPALEHRWLCHPERACTDGCDAAPLPDRLRVYQAVRSDRMTTIADGIFARHAAAFRKLAE